jgi:light-regulated signal transduction histidine kinase (bacteriophytochrome)
MEISAPPCIATPAKVSSCDDEPIHLSAAIQPHGIMLGFTPGTLRISAISANILPGGRGDPRSLLDAPLAQMIDAASLDHVTSADLSPGNSLRLPHLWLAGHQDAPFRAMLHAQPDIVLLEAELPSPDQALDAFDHFESFQSAILRVKKATDVEATCQRLVEEVRGLTGYSRVIVYRFAAAWSGEVVAESTDGKLPSFLGLHFPASDIPAQARELYSHTVIRHIPDVGYVPVPLLRRTGDSVDLSPAGLRSVSPIHIAYLRNMGIGAAMSISVMQNGALWGLVILHHATPLQVAPEHRQSSVLLTQLAAARFSLLEEAQVARRSSAAKAVESAMLHDAARGGEGRDAVLRNGGTMLDMLGATGLALSSGGTVTTLGDTPQGAKLQGLLAWLGDRETPVLAVDNLAAHYPLGAGMPEAAGLLAVQLGGAAQNLLVWFRMESKRTIHWAGEPGKAVEMVDGEERLMPRRSFAPWPIEVRGRSRPWSPLDVAAANSLRDTVAEIVVRGSLDIVRMNAQLLRSNQELEAFSYVASHDLKEPLRQIEIFATMLQRAFGRRETPPEKIERWFDGVLNASRRLRVLIDDLAKFARLGGESRSFAPVDLGDIVRDVLRDLDARIAEVSGSVHAAPLPVIMCDETQIRQMLQNLIGNALKFRHPDRAPIVRISAQMLPPSDDTRAAPLPIVALRIEDNGIGFEARHSERIFEPFERLHGAEAYEGTGLGLAICRKVAERHGGTMTATSRPGEGSIFTINLAFRPLPEQEAAAP